MKISSYIYKILNIDNILKWIENNFLLFVGGILMIIFYSRIVKFLMKVIEKLFLSKINDGGVRSFLKSFVKIGIHFLLIYSIMGLIGLDLTSVFAIIGALSVVVGFAFKDIIQNIFGGLVLLIFKPFKIDDVIEYENYVGSVKKIEIFYTKIINFQNEIVIIPNGLLVTNEVKNITSQNKRRLDLIIGVDYSSDLVLTKQIITNVINSCEYVLKEETITIGIGELAQSSINFITNVYVLPSNYLLAKMYILENIKCEFDKANISIPFNQLDVFIKNK